MTDHPMPDLPPTPDPRDQDLDASLDEEAAGRQAASKKQEPNVWLREGPDATDGADIEDPETQL